MKLLSLPAFTCFPAVSEASKFCKKNPKPGVKGQDAEIELRSCRLTYGLGLLSFDNFWALTAIISETSMIDDSVNGRNPAPADMENLSIFSSWVHIYIYISIYICIYISTGIRFPPSTVGLPFVQLKVIDANLRCLSALYLDPFLWKTSNPPTQPPCLPWHKMAHGDDIRPHLLLKQPTADLLRTIKLSSPLYVDAIFQKEINDYTFPEVVSNGFRSVSRYFANVWLYNLDKSHQISSQSHPIKSFALVIIQSDLSYASKPITKTHTQIINTQMISKHCSATFSFSNGPKPPMTPLQKKSTPFLPWLWPSAFDLQVEPFARKAADWKAPISTKSPVFLRLETPKVLGPGQKDGEKNKRLLRGMPASWENSA